MAFKQCSCFFRHAVYKDLSDFEKREELTLFDIQIKDLRQQLLPLNNPRDFSKQ